jgi:hypothetical protein
LEGVRLLFGIAGTPTRLDALAIELGNHLGVGMQVIEDSFCDWQESLGGAFKALRGQDKSTPRKASFQAVQMTWLYTPMELELAHGSTGRRSERCALFTSPFTIAVV